MFNAGREGLIEWLGFHAYLEDILDINLSGNYLLLLIIIIIHYPPLGLKWNSSSINV